MESSTMGKVLVAATIENLDDVFDAGGEHMIEMY